MVHEPAMNFAFTIGAYRLCDFVKLNVLQIRKLCPEAMILISDDRSSESYFMEKIANDLHCSYVCAREKRGHFAGDVQSILNSLAFAEAAGADVAVKISQRLIFRSPSTIGALRAAFEDPNIHFASPGQPKGVRGSKSTQGFGQFAVLSDLVCTRVGAIKPEEIKQVYVERIQNEIVPWKEFIEALIHSLHINKFPGHSSYLPELTDPGPDLPFLRRYQCAEGDYHRLAAEHGMTGKFPLTEWGAIEGGTYRPKALVV